MSVQETPFTAPKVPEFSGAEIDAHRHGDTTDPVFLAYWAARGIRPDMGDVQVKIDGVIQKMDTSTRDFGTIVDEKRQGATPEMPAGLK